MSNETNHPMGVIENLPFADYRADSGLNAGFLADMDVTPATARLRRDTPSIQSDAMLVGSALHCLVLEPEQFGKRYVQQPDFDRRTKAGKESAAAFAAMSNGADVLTGDQYAQVMGMADAIASHPVARQIRDLPALREVSIFWGHDGIRCKARIDCVQPERGIVWDLKSCRDASEFRFKYAAKDFRYDLRAAWYMRAIKAAPHVKFNWLAVESKAPFNVQVFEVGPQTMDAAWQRVEALLDRYKGCVKSGAWPRSYSDEIVTLELPMKNLDDTIELE